ncbi:hypothetical protein GCM10018966_035170 [Streptomyces yanii]
MRGCDLARRMLAALEDDARAAGRIRMVLETGTKQPEAIALYTSSGYEPCVKFGYYREYEDSRCCAKPLRPGTAQKFTSQRPAPEGRPASFRSRSRASGTRRHVSTGCTHCGTSTRPCCWTRARTSRR